MTGGCAWEEWRLQVAGAFQVPLPPMYGDRPGNGTENDADEEAGEKVGTENDWSTRAEEDEEGKED